MCPCVSTVSFHPDNFIAWHPFSQPGMGWMGDANRWWCSLVYPGVHHSPLSKWCEKLFAKWSFTTPCRAQSNKNKLYKIWSDLVVSTEGSEQAAPSQCWLQTGSPCEAQAGLSHDPPASAPPSQCSMASSGFCQHSPPHVSENIADSPSCLITTILHCQDEVCLDWSDGIP